MRKPFLKTSIIMGLLSTATYGIFVFINNNPAFSTDQSLETKSVAKSTQPKVSPSPQLAKTVVKSAKVPNYYQEAIDIATGAVTITESAINRDDWNLIALRWGEAIKSLKAVPTSSSQYKNAQLKLNEYQRYLTEAIKKAAPAPRKSCSSDTNPEFFFIPIKDRVGGIPIVEITFNEEHKFEMMFDTGASHTLITQRIASTLGLPPVGLTGVQIADGSGLLLETTTLDSAEVDGRVKRNMKVAIAPPKMPIGLLGHDFYKGYDINIRENVIEFHRQANLQSQTNTKVNKTFNNCSKDVKPQFFSVPIKTRKNGLPVVQVTLDGKHKSEMFVDTGATRSLIPQAIATKLKSPSIGKNLVTLADGSIATLDVAKIKSVQVNSRLKKDINMWIAPGMEIGLLGQDFFEGYNVKLKEKVIEFHRQRLAY